MQVSTDFVDRLLFEFLTSVYVCIWQDTEDHSCPNQFILLLSGQQRLHQDFSSERICGSIVSTSKSGYCQILSSTTGTV